MITIDLREHIPLILWNLVYQLGFSFTAITYKYNKDQELTKIHAVLYKINGDIGLLAYYLERNLPSQYQVSFKDLGSTNKYLITLILPPRNPKQEKVISIP